MKLIIIYFAGPNCGYCAYYSRRFLAPSDSASFGPLASAGDLSSTIYYDVVNHW